MSATDFVIGEKVEVHVHRSWYAGVVAGIKTKRLLIAYHTKDAGHQRTKLVDPDKVVLMTERGSRGVASRGTRVRKVSA